MQTIPVDVRNADFQILQSLKTNRSKRNKQRLVLVEGVAVINSLRASGLAVAAVIRATGRPLSGWGRALIEDVSPRVCYLLADDLMAEISDRDEPSEVIVLAYRPATSLANFDATDVQLAVVLDRPANPGNLGSLIRSCDAFGVDVVIVTGHAADVWDPRCIRASLGAVFTTPVVHEPSLSRLIDWLGRKRQLQPEFRVVGTDSNGSVAIGHQANAAPIALLFGNEARGLSRVLQDTVDEMVFIPMTGHVNSLNLASAVSISLYVISQRASRQTDFRS